MFLKADEKCYLTQSGTVDIKDRVFQQIAYITKPEEPTGDGTPENPIAYVKGVTVIENGKYYTQDGVKYLCIRNGEMALAYDLAELVSAGYVEEVETE